MEVARTFVLIDGERALGYFQPPPSSLRVPGLQLLGYVVIVLGPSGLAAVAILA